MQTRSVGAVGLVLIAGLFVALCHVWLVSAGYWAHWPMYSDRYDRLATAFAAGQTHLTIAPDPAMLALANPYDPVANEVYRKQPGVHDACLYNGKLYYYWGPTPGLMLVPAKLLLGNRVTIADQHLCFTFAMGLVAVTGLMLLRLRVAFYSSSPVWLPALGVLLTGLSTPITCIMTRAAVYEAAILGGQFFLLAGIYLAWRAISGFSAGADVAADSTFVNRRSHRALLLAGVCLANAVGSRVSLAVTVTAIGLVIVGVIVWRYRHQPRQCLKALAFFGLPLVVSAVGLCVYNAVRFDHPLQFGQKYQLGGADLLALPGLFGIDNLWPNLWSYFVRPIAGLDHFPFLIAVQGFEQFPAFIRIPPGYEIYEPISGLPRVMPVLVVIPLAAILGSRALSIARTPAPGTATKADDGGRALRTPVILLLLAAVLGFAPVLLMIGSSQRYLADFTPPLVIVAIVAVWHLTDVRRVSARSARRLLTSFTCLAAITLGIGVLISIDGYGAHFRLKNARLYESLGGQIEPESENTTDITHAKH
ncbi:hypothetical protein [Humisphaera borealis]|uniref:Uncharacterized protein n=1 Tax=Humisphaera borealis TaxID=2807512 RepID=A0A7M2WTM1_9BACT|nr:hypothetical protein [Humisphaera borealis]QOV87880.1 hypothetical protein IPV69_16520 [Humisphaera borealis]